jgi:hypothetical protein
MVGGEVIGVARHPDGTTLLHVAAVKYRTIGGKKSRVVDEGESLSVRCRERGHSVAPGDGVWWQCGKVYWTPAANRGKEGRRCHVDFDIELEKVGYSH